MNILLQGLELIYGIAIGKDHSRANFKIFVSKGGGGRSGLPDSQVLLVWLSKWQFGCPKKFTKILQRLINMYTRRKMYSVGPVELPLGWVIGPTTIFVIFQYLQSVI